MVAGRGQDVSYGLRLLRRTPTFTITALLTLAIGLGANTAIFSVVNTVLIKTVPYPAADRLALVWNSYGASLQHAAVAAPEFADIHEQQRAFDGVAAIRPQASSLTGECGGEAGCEPERVAAYVVSPNVFDLLGVAPATGRGFADDRCQPRRAESRDAQRRSLAAAGLAPIPRSWARLSCSRPFRGPLSA